MNINGKPIKCIAFDLDHTVVNSDGSMSDVTKAALKQAIADGIVVLPVSGRAFATFPEAICEMEGIDYVVTSNGAAVYDMKNKVRIHGEIIDVKDVHAIFECLDKFFSNGQITYEAFVDGVAYGDKCYVDDPMAFGVPQSSANYIQTTRRPEASIMEFMLKHEAELDSLDVVLKDGALYDFIEKQISDVTENIYITSAVSYRLEVSHKNSGKSTGLRYVLDKLGITPEETIAFGDGDNDAEMLAMAGIGVAMENATEKCKSSADTICGCCENDGVARFLYGF